MPLTTPLRRPSLLHTLAVSALLLVSSCRPGDQTPEQPLFSLVPVERSGLDFVNEIIEQEAFNVLEYEYFYNGGGVAVGDINNDGLPDLYFTANMGPDRLFLNKGNLQFEDITGSTGIVENPNWTTGVTMADVNGDGFLDIYVCRSGKVSEERRRNALYINNGDLTFTDRAAEYGIDDPSYSTHATFFDYDRDGDLDLFLLNHSIERYFRFNVYFMKQQRDPLAGDKLYRNDNGRFVNVSEEAGIIGNPLGFGLSAIVSDINKDGWLDLYVANDYVEDDYLYINNRDGTFREEVRSWFAHTSYSSMGSDIGDFNNDGLPDILTLDMLAEDNLRQKLLKGPEDFRFYENMRLNGYHEQYMRNMLQLNNGNGSFSEIGQLAGIATTDWSWAALFADFDRDGFKDILVTNGYMRDYTNMDFLEFTLKEAFMEAQQTGKSLSAHELVQHMPTSPLRNYIYRNNGHLQFEDKSVAWGLDHSGLSNGAVFADLDRDGDLDIVVNNINAAAYLYENLADVQLDTRFLQIRLEGPAGDRFGIGSKVQVTGPNGEQFYREMVPSRGYLSAVEPELFFGVGDLDSVEVTVVWTDQSVQHLEAVPTNQFLTLRHEDASRDLLPPIDTVEPNLFVQAPDARGILFRHAEDGIVDFEQQPLIPHVLSRFGPALAHADVNRDGLEDIFVGGAAGQPGALFLQQIDGTFREGAAPDFVTHAPFEDVAAVFLDADNDGDADLYVVSGGNLMTRDGSIMQDRLYLNSGFGMFTYDETALPQIESSGGTAAASDYDGDGRVDLFVGGRVLPGQYPFAPRSFVLRNEGGRFTDVTEDVAPDLVAPGMISDAIWADLDGDGRSELVLAGEWMPLRVFSFDAGRGRFVEHTRQAGLDRWSGWWNTVRAVDLNADGHLDLVAGNRGLNSLMGASPKEPAIVVASDFDRDGAVEPIVGYYILGQQYPAAWRDELTSELPHLMEPFSTHEAYARSTLDEVLSHLDTGKALRLEATEFATSLFVNDGEGSFEQRRLPLEAQFAPVHAVVPGDFDGDGNVDLLLAGNTFWIRSQWGRDDAGQGLLLRGDGAFGFRPVWSKDSGFFAPGEVRRMLPVSTPAGPLIIVANNDDAVTVFGF